MDLQKHLEIHLFPGKIEKKIKKINDSIKVVMISGVEDKDVVDEAYKLGASDYVIKPFDFKKVEALVLSLLTTSQ